MPQPSRLFQQRACTASRRICLAQHRIIDTERRPPCNLSRLYSTAITSRELCLFRNSHWRFKYGGSWWLTRSRHIGASGLWQSSTSPIGSGQGIAVSGYGSLLAMQELDRAERAALDGQAMDWHSVVQRMGRAHGAEGLCVAMTRLRESKALDIVISSDRIQSAFVYAAIQLPEYLPELFACAEDLLQRHDYRWPNIYTKTLHGLLEKCAFKEAVQAHLRLATAFLPEGRILGMLFENFVIEQGAMMQNTLKTIYVSLPRHNLYDSIIPALFNSGQSYQARNWRKTLLVYGDSPTSASSRHFLRFLARYYTNIRLSQEELAILNTTHEVDVIQGNVTASNIKTDWDAAEAALADTTIHAASPHPENATAADSLVAKLFASSWTPVDFAIRLVKNAGVRSIGSRAFQALALREKSAEDVGRLIKQLHELNISIPTGAYSIAISEFARQGEHTLLTDLLHSDIHPDEFDDRETREMILFNSILKQDSKQQRLMRGVMSAVNTDIRRSAKLSLSSCSTSAKLVFPLDKTIFDEPWQMKLAVDRMLSLEFRMGQADASAILRKAFASFPVGRHGIAWRSDECIRLLDETIGVIRSVATQDVAIPAEYWKVLLFGLGHQGKFDTLEQFSLEILQMYDNNFEGLYTVHEMDLPRCSKTVLGRMLGFEQGDNDWRKTHIIGYMPADLPFNHQHHPIYKIFDAKFQRAAVGLGFNCALENLPASASNVVQITNASKFNFACGIRYLASLRDRGVQINQNVVESAARHSIQSAHRERQRDGNIKGSKWLSKEQMKNMMDLAWGAPLLPVEALPDGSQSSWRSLLIHEDENWL